MTDITEEIQQPKVGNYIEFYELDATAIGGSIFRFTPYTNSGALVMWQSVNYTPIPINGVDFESPSEGVQPNPRLILDNVSKILHSEVIALGDLVGTMVTRKRTLTKFLDGEPDADPNKFFPDQIYYIQRKVNHNKALIEWELSTSIDQEGLKLPRRQVLRDFGFPGVARTRVGF